MKVRFLKQHLSYKEGGEYDVTDELGNYLIKMKVVDAETKEKAEVKSEKVTKEKVSKAGPNAPKKKRK